MSVVFSVVVLVSDKYTITTSVLILNSPAAKLEENCRRHTSPGSSLSSSLGSSIRVCDESGCSLGYLGSSEFDGHVVSDAADDSCTRNIPASSETVQADDQVKVSEPQQMLNDDSEVYSAGVNLTKSVQPNCESPTKVTGNDVKTSYSYRTDTHALSEDGWVIVDSEGTQIPNTKPGMSFLKTSRSSPINITGNSFLNSSANQNGAHVFADPRDDDTSSSCDDVDWSEWAVLSMKITEVRPDLYENKDICLKDSMNSVHRIESPSRRSQIQAPGTDPSASPLRFSMYRDDSLDPLCRSLKMNGSDWMVVCLFMPKH